MQVSNKRKGYGKMTIPFSFIVVIFFRNRFSSLRFFKIQPFREYACFTICDARCEAQCHYVLANGCFVLWQTRVATARVVADATLPEVEMSKHLLATCEVVRMFATVEHIVVELLVVVVRERESKLSLNLHVERSAICVFKREFA